MARPASTFRPADLEEDAPPPYAATAPESDSTTVPDPQQYQPSYPSLDTSYLVQQQQQQQQQLQQLHVGLPSTPPPPIHYYPVMPSAAGQTTSTLLTTATPVVPPPLQYPQYPMLSTAGDGTGASAYPIYPATSSQSGVYHVPQAYPMMGSGHPSPYGAAAAAAAAAAPAGPGAGSTAHAQGGSSYPAPYPSATGMPPSHHSGSHFPQYHAPLAHFAPPPGPPPLVTATVSGTGSPAASTSTISTTSTAASPYFSPSPAPRAIAAPPPHQQQQQQPVLFASAPNVAATTPAVLPTAPEGNLIDLDDINGQWEQPEPPRAPHVHTSSVLPPMSTFAVLSPIPAAAPGAPHTGVATSPAVPPQVSPLPLPAAPPAVLPDLVTLYKCRKCGATLDSDTAVCRRIHVGGLSGERQVNQATEADLNERRKLASHANGSGAPSNGSSSTVGSQGSTEGTTVYDSNHGTSDVYLNHRQYNRSRRSEESTPQIVSPPCLTNESLSTGGTLGRATSMVNPSTHQYHSTASTNDNHGTNDVYIRRSFTTQNPVSSLKKLWRDTKKELMTDQQPPYSSRNHELVAPPPLPPMQQPYPQPEQYRPSPLYPHHHHHPEAAQQQQHDHMGYPVLSSSMTAVGSTISGSTNPFDDPPTPAYNPAHVPVYIPELPTRSQQQQQQPLPAPSAPPPSHSW